MVDHVFLQPRALKGLEMEKKGEKKTELPPWGQISRKKPPKVWSGSGFTRLPKDSKDN